MKIRINKPWVLKKIIPVIAGATLGYSYYYFIGCNGTCLISGNPYISTLYGAGLGLLYVLPLSTKTKNETNN